MDSCDNDVSMCIHQLSKIYGAYRETTCTKLKNMSMRESLNLRSNKEIHSPHQAAYSSGNGLESVIQVHLYCFCTCSACFR